jgi:hypothetical protein
MYPIPAALSRGQFDLRGEIGRLEQGGADDVDELIDPAGRGLPKTRDVDAVLLELRRSVDLG